MDQFSVMFWLTDAKGQVIQKEHVCTILDSHPSGLAPIV
jgi:hypothetical protein